jgi:hypothetical protein
MAAGGLLGSLRSFEKPKQMNDIFSKKEATKIEDEIKTENKEVKEEKSGAISSSVNEP